MAAQRAPAGADERGCHALKARRRGAQAAAAHCCPAGTVLASQCGMQRDAAPSTFAVSGLQGPAEHHRIVIVGGGAGGLELAARLGDALHAHRGRGPQAEVLLVDASLTHVWKPLLHELAAGTLANSDTIVDFLQQARQHHFRFHLGQMASLDRARQEVWLAPLVDELGEEIAPRRAIRYDTLVLAVGSIVNDFGTPGVREHALALNSAGDAEAFHRRLIAACARAELNGGGPVDVVIVGGGATGVELAAELMESVRELARYGEHLRELQRPVRLRVVEAGPRLVAAMPEAVSQRVQADLAALGIEVLLGQRVTQVSDGQVMLKDGQGGTQALPAQLAVWAAGIQGPPVLQQLDGLELNKLHQLVVRPTLQTTHDDAVFALGDCASCAPEPGAAAVPPRAQAAHQEARFLAGVLLKRLQGQPLPGFRFHDRGALVSIGSRDAVGNVSGGRGRRSVMLEGLLARLAYWTLQRQHIATLHGLGRTVLSTIGGWMAGRFQPRVKLH
jgi:NADH dehydrogenase